MQNTALRLPSWQAFSSIAAKGLKVFLFYLAVLSFCRAFFIFWLHDYMAAATGGADVSAVRQRGGLRSFPSCPPRSHAFFMRRLKTSHGA